MNILNDNVMATRMLNAAKPWTGEAMKFPIKFSQNNTFQTFSGMDTFATTVQDNFVNLSYNPAFSQISVALPLTELSVNATSEKVIDLMGLTMTSAAQDFADKIGDQLWTGSGTGNDFNSFNTLIDDGSVSSTLGGLSRATYTTLVSTVTASGGALTLAKLATLYNAVTFGNQMPTVGYCNKTVFSLYENLLQPQERLYKDASNIKGKMSNGSGYTALYYRGVPILADFLTKLSLSFAY